MIFDMGKNIRRYGKVGFYIPEEGRRRKIFGKGKYFLRRIRNKRRKRRKVFVERKFSFTEEMKIREGKGGKLLEKENILCGGHGTETEGSARGPRGPKIE